MRQGWCCRPLPCPSCMKTRINHCCWKLWHAMGEKDTNGPLSILLWILEVLWVAHEAPWPVTHSPSKYLTYFKGRDCLSYTHFHQTNISWHFHKCGCSNERIPTTLFSEPELMHLLVMHLLIIGSPSDLKRTTYPMKGILTLGSLYCRNLKVWVQWHL